MRVPPPDVCRDLGSGPRAYDAVSYQLRARFDWDAGRLLAQEDATLTVCPGAGTTVELDSRVEAAQERALWAGYPFMPIGAREDLAGTLAALDSSYARELLLLDACIGARSEPALVAPVVAALQHPPRLRNFSYDRCPAAVVRAMEPEFLALAADAGVAQLGRLEYLMSFRYADAGVAAMHALAVRAPTRRLRVLARSFETRPPAPLRGDGPVEAGKAWWTLEDAPRPGPPDARLLEGKGARAAGR